MTLYRQWRDFVVFSKDPDLIKTEAERFGLTDAPGAYLVKKDDIIRPDDEFVAMRVDVIGNVIVWTKKIVLTLQRMHRIERFVGAMRDPYDDDPKWD